MKKIFTCIAFCTIFTFAFPGCRKADLETGLPVPEVASAANQALVTKQTAQSVMYNIDFDFPSNNASLTPVYFTIAAESFVINKTFPNNGVYSFRLLSNTGVSQISKLWYAFNDGPWKLLPYTITSGCNDAGGILNTFFWANQSFGTAQSYLKDGLIGEILAGDDDPGNDNACRNADIAKATVLLPLRAGVDFTIKIYGEVKGVQIYNELKFIIDTCGCSFSRVQ